MKWIVKNVRKRRKQRKGGRMTLLIAPYNAPTLNEGERMSSPRFSRFCEKKVRRCWNEGTGVRPKSRERCTNWGEKTDRSLICIALDVEEELKELSAGLVPESHEALKRNSQDGKGWRRNNNLCPQWMRTARAGGAECLSEEEEGKKKKKRKRCLWWRMNFYGLLWKEAKKEECNSTVENRKNSTTRWRLIPILFTVDISQILHARWRLQMPDIVDKEKISKDGEDWSLMPVAFV